MNSAIARELLMQEVVRTEALSYAEAKGLIASGLRTIDVIGSDKKKYQIEVQAFWDSKKEGDVRMLCSIDDGGLGAFVPLTEGVLKKKEPN